MNALRALTAGMMAGLLVALLRAPSRPGHRQTAYIPQGTQMTGITTETCYNDDTVLVYQVEDRFNRHEGETLLMAFTHWDGWVEDPAPFVWHLNQPYDWVLFERHVTTCGAEPLYLRVIWRLWLPMMRR